MNKDARAEVKKWLRHKPVHLKDSFMRVVKDLGLNITVKNKKEEGVRDYFTDDEAKNIENIEAIKKIRNRKIPFDVYYYSLFKDEIRLRLKNMSDKELLEKVKSEKNLIQVVDIDDTVLMTYDGNDMKIYCGSIQGHSRALFKKIIRLCLEHCLEVVEK